MKNSGELRPAQGLTPIARDAYDRYRNLTVSLHVNSREKWWEVLEECSDEFYNETLSHLPYADCEKSLVLYTFSDKLFPSTLNWLTAGGYVLISNYFIQFRVPVRKKWTFILIQPFSFSLQSHWYLYHVCICCSSILSWIVLWFEHQHCVFRAAIR